MSDQGEPDQGKSDQGEADRDATEDKGAAKAGSADALLREAVHAATRRRSADAPTAVAAPPVRRPDLIAGLRARAGLGAGLAAALACGVILGGGGLAAYHRLANVDRHQVSAAEWTRIAARLESGGAEGDRVAADLKLLKEQIAVLREQGERARTEAGARASQTAERLTQIQRSEKDAGERLTMLSERLDRLDKDAAARLAGLGERLEKRLPATPVATAAPATPVAAAAPKPPAPEDRTGSLPDAKPKPPTLEAWILRDVFDGIAVVEGRNQRLVEVAPGETLPGGGRVEAIERRGKTWVVVTSKGLITSQAW